jgi:hypothetical protein
MSSHKFSLSQILIYLALLPSMGMAQVSGTNGSTTDGRQGSKVIITGVPFLLIAPDSRSGAMGDAGAAIFPDPNSIHWNPSKLAFVENNTGISISYSPWLQKLVPDINLAYLSAFHRIGGRNTIGGSLRYFSLGQIDLIDASQNYQGTYNPSEFAIDATFSRGFGDNFSLGTAVRFIYSNLSNGQFLAGQQTRPATALAADISAYYKNETQMLGDDARFGAGINISNIGNKMSYVEGGTKAFLPTNMKLGLATTFFWDNSSEFTVAFDINKLLVPSPPEVERDPVTGQPHIVKGRDASTLSVPQGIFGSFTDAPGGFKEEMQEISYSTGIEYWYNHQLALRSGFFYENPTKGDRQYLSLGAGLKYNILNIDFAYLVANQQRSPLANTLRFSLVFNFVKKQNGP